MAFQGALSSTASLTQLTIADDKGVWLTLKDVKLDWSRSALLSGHIQVDQLSAGEIDLEAFANRPDQFNGSLARGKIAGVARYSGFHSHQGHCGTEDRSWYDGSGPTP